MQQIRKARQEKECLHVFGKICIFVCFSLQFSFFLDFSKLTFSSSFHTIIVNLVCQLTPWVIEGGGVWKGTVYLSQKCWKSHACVPFLFLLCCNCPWCRLVETKHHPPCGWRTVQGEMFTFWQGGPLYEENLGKLVLVWRPTSMTGGEVLDLPAGQFSRKMSQNRSSVWGVDVPPPWPPRGPWRTF